MNNFSKFIEHHTPKFKHVHLGIRYCVETSCFKCINRKEDIAGLTCKDKGTISYDEYEELKINYPEYFI